MYLNLNSHGHTESDQTILSFRENPGSLEEAGFSLKVLKLQN